MLLDHRSLTFETEAARLVAQPFGVELTLKQRGTA